MTTQTLLVADVRSRIDEPTAQFISDVEIRRWINQAVKDFARRTETIQATSTISSVAGTQSYTGPTDVVRVYRVEYINASNAVTPLEYRDFNNMDSVWWNQQLTTTGTPMLYTMWGYPPSLSIILYPTPSISSETIKVYYYKMPAELATDGSATSSTITIPSGREELIVDFCEYMALRKARDPRWQEAKALYDEKVNEAYDQTRRWTDQAGMMVADGVPLPQWIWDENYT